MITYNTDDSVELSDIDAWHEFVGTHHDQIIDACGTVDDAYLFLINGGLQLNCGDKTTYREMVVYFTP